MARTTDKKREYDAKVLLTDLGYTLVEPNKYTCNSCGKQKSLKQNNFYKTDNPLYSGCSVEYEAQRGGENVLVKQNVLPWCKSCIEKRFKDLCIKTLDNKKLALYKLTQEMQVVWSESAYEGASGQKTVLWKGYFQKINSLPQYHGLTIDDSDEYIGDENAVMQEELELKTKRLGKGKKEDLIREWGVFPDDELLFLDNEYSDWATRYTVDTKGMEVLVKQICHQQLAIKKIRESGGTVNKELKDLQDLMNSSALKPIQESAAMGNEANTLGVWIKRIENEEPIADVKEEYRDVDGIGKMIRIFFLGHFNKMLGIKNELSEEYEREMALHTVSLEDGDEDVV